MVRNGALTQHPNISTTFIVAVHQHIAALCVQGVPPQYRGWVWEQVSGAARLMHEHMNNYYEAMVHQGEASSPSARQVELVTLNLTSSRPHNH